MKVTFAYNVSMSRAIPSSPPAATPPRFGKRRWFQYSLRTLLILTTMIAVGFAWWSHAARRQRAAVAALEKARATVHYDFRMEKSKRPRYWPTWLVDRLGVDYFATVDWVSCGQSATDEQLKPLLELRKLTNLDLSYTRVSDAVMIPALKNMSALKWLDLNSSKITDASVAQLEHLTDLRQIYLNRTQVTDAGVSHLKNHARLKRLGLYNTHLTDAGLAHLTGLTELETLYLQSTHITDAGLAHLTPLQKLETLDVSYTQVTDAGLVHLKGMKQLKNLRLGDTKVSDAGLQHLKGLAALRELNLNGTHVSRSAMLQLAKQLPQCQVLPIAMEDPVSVSPDGQGTSPP